MRAFGFDRQSFGKMLRGAALAGFAAAAFTMAPTPAQAFPFPPSPADVHRHVVNDVRHALEVPRAIHRAHVDAFHSFFHGTSYYAPHHHAHAVYNFPVYYGGHVVYRPYSYCNDALFIGGGVPVPTLAVSVGSDGFYYAAAPAPLPPPPPRYVVHAYAYPVAVSYPCRHDRGRHNGWYKH